LEAWGVRKFFEFFLFSVPSLGCPFEGRAVIIIKFEDPMPEKTISCIDYFMRVARFRASPKHGGQEIF